MTERIVVGVDGSPTSGKALVWAAAHAARRRATLDIVMAWQTPGGAVTPMGMAYIPPPSETLRQHAEDRLNQFVAASAHSAALGPVDHELIVAEREASRLLCDVAQGAELLVVGSRGLGGFKGLVLGSVSARCANASPCPLAIIPEEWDPERPPAGIVAIGVDGSPNANAAVEWADRWAPTDSTLRLVGAWSYPVAYTMAELEIDDEHLEAACAKIVEEATGIVSDHRVEPAVVREDARPALAAAAEQADILVIGARGHGGFSRLVLGSVAANVVHHLVAPTVVVRAEAAD